MSENENARPKRGVDHLSDKEKSLIEVGHGDVCEDCGEFVFNWNDCDCDEGRRQTTLVTDGGVSNVLCGHEQDPNDNEYATPPEIWRPLARAVDGFDVDPASGAESTPIAPMRFTKEDDGLSKAWHGWVFCNPPWATDGDGSAKDRWLRKARNEANRDAVDGVVVLLPADTSAHWFHEHLLAADALCLVGPGRIPFEGEDRNPSFQMAIAVYGEVPDALVDALDELGAVIRGREVVDPTPQATLVTDGGERLGDGVSHYCEAINGRLPYAEQQCAYCRRYLEVSDGDA
ncbi:phage N-6-adenine-methyltransferase [Halobellus inordinatus]|uniref:phage N-6-adenine-methyltransferase n=1 Tax=Halobellus inordinatus TaxID=1126236 RepID=UPI00210E44AC|nr:phage N-6-adenine-methyltransferase [Halobellus inordinatus]